MHILSVSNQKGGCGKTTTAVNLAAYLAQSGRKVLLVDLDPQGSATKHLGVRNVDGTMYDVIINGKNVSDIVLSTGVNNLDLAPTNNTLGRAELELATRLTGRELRLSKSLMRLSGYDYVIVDTPPTLGFLTLNALVAADTVIIPIETQYFSVVGLSIILDLLGIIESDMGHRVVKKYLLTIHDQRTKMSQQIVDYLRETLSEHLFNTIIPVNIRLAEAPSYGMTILQYAPDSTGAKAYESLAREVIELCEARVMS